MDKKDVTGTDQNARLNGTLNVARRNYNCWKKEIKKERERKKRL